MIYFISIVISIVTSLWFVAIGLIGWYGKWKFDKTLFILVGLGTIHLTSIEIVVVGLLLTSVNKSIDGLYKDIFVSIYISIYKYLAVEIIFIALRYFV